MIYKKEYDELDDDEKIIRVNFEQRFRCNSPITEEERDYLLNCLSHSVALKDNELVDVSISGEKDNLKILALGGKKPYISLNGDALFVSDFLEINLRKEQNDKRIYLSERFIQENDYVIHLDFGEDSYEEVERIPIENMNFVDNVKSNINKKK